MTKTTKKSSAKRKLIPAVGMLTTSAIMLSSATYAWFTMNKEVEVTGLQMEAVAGDALEISLGAYKASYATFDDIVAPSDKNDASWKRSVAFSEYYNSFGALKPASSDTGLSLFKADENEISGGGAKVTAASDIEAVPNAATICYKNDADIATFKPEDESGYYVDIPMWIRSNKIVDGSGTIPINCSVSITEWKLNENDTTKTDGKLKNAVRVAIIPTTVSAGQNNFAAVSTKTVNSTYTANIANNGAKVFSLTDTLHTDSPGVLKNAAVKGYGVADNHNSSVTNNRANAEIPDDFTASGVEKTVTFNLPSAAQDDYTGSAFVVRVWIEGESSDCLDATADQDWRIDLHFELAD